MISVLLADDQALVRGGLRAILDAQDDIDVVAEASDGREAVELASAHRPDVVLMDIRMPRLDGIEATRRLASDPSPMPAVLVLTTFDVDRYVYDALAAGAAGFLLKDAPPSGLVDAIRTVAAGDALLAPTITRRLIESFVGTPRPDEALQTTLAELTERELDVLEQVAAGRSNREIAGTLTLSEATIKTHVTRILRKLDLRDRVQAVVLAYESGLVRPGNAGQP